MFAINEVGRLRRIRRKPRNWDTLKMRGWVFISEARRWGVDERDAVINAIPTLYALGRMLDGFSDTWLKERATEYCSGKPIKLIGDPDYQTPRLRPW